MSLVVYKNISTFAAVFDDLLFQKEQEIEEGYQRYLEEKEKHQEEKEEMNFYQSFRMYNVEE